MRALQRIAPQLRSVFIGCLQREKQTGNMSFQLQRAAPRQSGLARSKHAPVTILFSGAVYISSIPQLSTRFFLRVISIFPAWALRTYALNTLERTWTSTAAHGVRDPSLAAPMLTARFSYTRRYGYKLALYIVRATQAHSPARGIAPARP